MNHSQNHNERAVITGLGVATALGLGLDRFWDSLLAGESGIRTITRFDASELPCQIAGEVSEYEPADHFKLKDARKMARASQLAIVSARSAVADSGLTLPFSNPGRVGVCIGTGVGGLDKAEDGIEEIRAKGISRLSPFALPISIPNMPAFHITGEFGASGPNLTITTACATGTQAVGEGAQLIRDGRADIVIAGGTESILRFFAVGAFTQMRAMPTNFNDDPAKASRPFDAKREGFVFSEGAACLVLERLDLAIERNAHIYAEVTGHASSSDGFHMAAPDPEAKAPIQSMIWALEDAGLKPEDIDYINAHGTSTPLNDAVETYAIKQVFGEGAYNIPISSTKSMIGHALGAAGGIEAVVSALTIDRQLIHPTINYEFPDPDCDLDYVPNQTRDAKVEHVLSNSFGLGSQNACLILSRVDV
ncbi:MAG: beta-ketoacyl-ACP synthase II [Anaerolineales bacterium]|nr:beta-ketoacyl-ACP synthase II [Anaerolineales bacterium]